MFIVNFIFGILIAIGGVAVIKYSYPIGGMFGTGQWMSRYLGAGSIYFVIKMVGLFFILVGFLVMFSLHDNFINWFFGPVLDGLGLRKSE